MAARTYLTRFAWFAIIAAGLLLGLLRPLISGGYHWDLDHEIYFGSRLLESELIWTTEFQDKLPVIQYLFLIPAWLGTQTAWTIINYVAVVLAVVIFARTPLRLLTPRSSSTNDYLKHLPKMLGLAVFLGVVVFSPNGPEHISALPASFALASLILALKLREDVATGSSKRGATSTLIQLFSASLLAAVAISIRPYLFVPMALIILWLLVDAYARPQSAIGLRFVPLALVALTLVWGIALNLGPYLATGQLNAFTSGVSVLAQDLNPMNGAERMLTSPVAMGLLGLAVVIFMVGLASLRRVESEKRIGLVFAAAGVMLWLSISQVHWWGHYGPLFAPFLSLAFAWTAGLAQDLGWFERIPTNLRALFFPLASMATFLAGLVLATNLWGVRDFLDGRWPSNLDKSALAVEVHSVISEPGLNSRDFLYVENMHVHWALDQGRHGFPHSANATQLISGWWSAVDAFDTPFLFPKSTERLCANLISFGPSLVFVEQEELANCLDESPAYSQKGAVSSGAIIFEKLEK